MTGRSVLSVFGTRPEAIKMMPVVRALRERAGLTSRVAVTGQHRSMLDQVFTAFGEQADIDLDLMTPGQTLTEITAGVVEHMGRVLADERPALVLVHGDTTTAMATALACFYARVPVGHVEAGLRSHDMGRPWPEEFNRIAIDAIADLLFAPTAAAAAHLERESPRDRTILITGNTGIDALLSMATRLDRGHAASCHPRLDNRRMILVTGHRRESFGGGFEGICEALVRLADRDDVQIVYPVHLNPHVSRVVGERLGGRANVHLIPPVDYPTMVHLMRMAHLILTDSGGIQEEGPALGRPVLVMRDVTERPEAIDTGVARLVGTNPLGITAAAERLLDDADHYAACARAVFPYGDGTAATKIVDAVAHYLEAA